METAREKIDKFRQSQEQQYAPDTAEGKLQAVGKYAGNLESEIESEFEKLGEAGELTDSGRSKQLQPLVKKNIEKLEARLPRINETIEQNTALLNDPPSILAEPVEFQEHILSDFLSKSGPERAKFAAIEAKRDPKIAAVLIKAGRRLTGLTDETENVLKAVLFTDDEKKAREQAARELSVAQRTVARISRSTEAMRRY